MKLGLGLLAAPAHRVERRFEFICQADALLTLIKTIGAPNIGILYDTWNWRVGGGSLDQLRKRGRDFIVAVRVADAPADIDTATAVETDRLLPTEGGAVDLPNVFALLNELEYEGPVSMFPHPSRFVGRTREAIVQEANNELETLLKVAEPSEEEVGAEA
jgi:sugar phosphate isomerase/epimerase